MEAGWKWKINCDPLLVNSKSVAEMTTLEEFVMGVSPMINNTDCVIWPFDVGIFFC